MCPIDPTLPQASYSTKKSGILAKSRSALKCLGPETFITTPHASVRAAVSDWSIKRWKTSWKGRTNCLITTENVEWASPRFTLQLLCLKRLNKVLQVLAGQFNLQNHRNTIGR